MITKTINLYEFKELKPEIQEKVLDDNREINVSDSFWYEDDCLLEPTFKELQKAKIKFKDYKTLFVYDKFYFSIDREWYIDFVNLDVNNTEIFRKFLGIPKVLFCNCYWYFTSKSCRNSTTELIIEPSEKAFTEKQQNIIDNAIAKMNNKIQDALKILDQQYDYLTSDEAIIDFFESNEMLFTKKGDIYYE